MSTAISRLAGRPPRFARARLALLACALWLGPGAARAQQAPDAAAPSGPARTFNNLPEQHILDEIRTGRILSRQPVGSTSVNYHLHLASDVDAAFKTRSRTHGMAYLAEIAAFRLNRLLGLSRVPPAISRVVPSQVLRLPPDSPVTLERDGSVRGAALYWVPVLRDSRIDEAAERERWQSWLRQRGTVPPEQTVRAEEISTLVLFDFLTGNWDRWSGSNVPMDPAGHLVYRDNNGGFGEPFTDANLQGVMFHLRGVQRFSRSVVARARALTEASVRAEMALDGEPSVPLLSATQVASLLRRRDTLMAYIDDLVRHYSDAAVLPFP